MTPFPPAPGSVSVDTIGRPMDVSAVQNVAAVVLGLHEDGTPAVQISLGRVSGPSLYSTVHFITDPDLVDGLAHALMTAADHLREAGSHGEDA